MVFFCFNGMSLAMKQYIHSDLFTHFGCQNLYIFGTDTGNRVVFWTVSVAKAMAFILES